MAAYLEIPSHDTDVDISSILLLTPVFELAFFLRKQT